VKAVVKAAEGAGHIELRDVPEPQAGPGEVRIQVHAAGICGSDLHILHGDIGIPMRPPFIIGHEFTGVIDSLGPDVARWQPGQRVTAENSRSVCGHCPECVTGNYNLCPERRATGYAFDGAFAPFCVVPQERVHLLPDSVDFITGALSDPVACAYHAVHDFFGVLAGETVLVTGPGPMGLLCLQFVKANGGVAILTGTSADAARLALGREFGADVTVNVEAEDLSAIVSERTHGRGVDRVLECSGAESAAQAGLELVRKRGTYTQVGIFGKPIKLDLDQMLYKEVRVAGSFSQKYVPWEQAIALMAQGRIRTRPLVTHLLPLDQWEMGFHLFDTRKAIKVVFEPQK